PSITFEGWYVTTLPAASCEAGAVLLAVTRTPSRISTGWTVEGGFDVSRLRTTPATAAPATTSTAATIVAVIRNRVRRRSVRDAGTAGDATDVVAVPSITARRPCVRS